MIRAYGVDMTQGNFLEKITRVPGQPGKLYKEISALLMHAPGLRISTAVETVEGALATAHIELRLLGRRDRKHDMGR